jgi:hypothetical protein
MYQPAGDDLEIVFWLAIMLGGIAFWLAVLFAVRGRAERR